jgi:hypothetical protein
MAPARRRRKPPRTPARRARHRADKGLINIAPRGTEAVAGGGHMSCTVRFGDIPTPAGIRAVRE